MNGCTCANCGRERHTTVTYDERAELYFCDADCWRSWASLNFERIFDYYRMCNVVDDEEVGG